MRHIPGERDRYLMKGEAIRGRFAISRKGASVGMEDPNIIGLLFERSERALDEIQKKYGKEMAGIAYGVVGSREDAEEIVNDALRVLWGRIPPEYPDPLSTYVFRIVRNLSLARLRDRNRLKRTPAVVDPLDELTESIAAVEEPDQLSESREITLVINEFLSRLDRTGRMIFVSRYWYSENVAEIAKKQGMTRVAVSARLARMRKSLAELLKERGIDL